MEQTAVRKGKGKKIAFRTLTHVVLILCSLTMLIPFLWMISSSLKNMDELFAVPPYWIPKDVAWENYVYMFEQAPCQHSCYRSSNYLRPADNLLFGGLCFC